VVFHLVKPQLPEKRGKNLSESIRAVERALDVLLCFNKQTPELNMTQIAEQIRIHKSTVHRLLKTLEKRRFVERDQTTGVYRLGIQLLQMAYLTLEQNDLRRLAAPFLRQLWEQHRETVHLTVLEQADVVYLDSLESPQRVKLAAAIGQRLPAFTTASGRAILAFMPEEAVQEVLKQGMPQYTPQTRTSPEAFWEACRLVRENGFALDEQEFEEGIDAVAAPILDQFGQPLAAVSVAGPAYRLAHDRLMEIGPSVLAAARDIAREIDLSAHRTELPAEKAAANVATGK
jgi:DNA-binding IclR family transcriptional regulator